MHAFTSTHQDLLHIRAAALQAVDPSLAVRRYIQRTSSRLELGSTTWNLDPSGRVFLVAAGKAAVLMVLAAADLLGEALTSGILVTRYGHAAGAVLPPRLKMFEAGHPIPDENGLAGAQAILELLAQLEPADHLLVLLSGGASALIPCPAPPVTLADLQRLTNLLLSCGATINELNSVRKHLDLLKGGRLAQAAGSAGLVALILSDVVGDSLEVIASGPTAPDPTTFADALGVLERYALLENTPPAIIQRLQQGSAGQLSETPKPGDPLFDRISNQVIGSNRLAAQAAAAEAHRLGYAVLLLSTRLQGEAREIGKVAAALACSCRKEGDPLPAPACLVLGGETTVTLAAPGQGGRNQELALSAAQGIAGLPGTAIMALATDGSDGPTDAAGAIVDGQTWDIICQHGRNPAADLSQHNSFTALQAADALMFTGPTGTNVNDLLVILIAPEKQGR